MKHKAGFTLIELLVVIAIIGILVAVLSVSFTEARQQSRDKIRMSTVKEVQLAIELYKAQNGRYPVGGCGATPGGWSGNNNWAVPWYFSCEEWIVGLAPDFIAQLPTDPSGNQGNARGYIYSTDATGSLYKFMSHGDVESLFVQSYDNEFARCPAPCPGQTTADQCSPTAPPTYMYAVYSAGAQCW